MSTRVRIRIQLITPDLGGRTSELTDTLILIHTLKDCVIKMYRQTDRQRLLMLTSLILVFGIPPSESSPTVLFPLPRLSC